MSTEPKVGFAQDGSLGTVTLERAPLNQIGTEFIADLLAIASRAYRGTRNLRAVQTLLRHSSIATTERYTAVDDEIRAAVLSAL